MDFEQETLLWLLLRRKKRWRVNRTYRVHPLIEDRSKGQFFLLYRDLRNHDDKIFNYFRISKSTLDFLLEVLKSHINMNDTVMRKSIPPEERLALTLRYLGSGISFQELFYSYRCGSSTARGIVAEVCKTLWTVLKKDFISEPTKSQWEDIATGFDKKANFPNCLGAIDGKHIRIIKPPNSGSSYFNYKKYFSIILLAVCDSNYLFTYIDVGACRMSSDSSVFKDSTLYSRIQNNLLDIPEPKPITTGGARLPYAFVGDEAFGLSTHILRPYGGKQLIAKKRTFNYRLSRARRYIECAFGILANKWRILHKPLNVSMDLAIDIVKACTILHNVVPSRDGYNFEDTSSYPDFQELSTSSEYRVSRNTNLVRDQYADYFSTPQGELHWQYNKI